MTSMPALPRILLVEDEPTSSAFLAAAARAVPAQVDVADSVAAALALAKSGRYDLWLFDATLPDGNGSDLLARLQDQYPMVRAIAHTASNEPALLRALRLAGFDDVLVKPLPATTVQTAVRRILRLPLDGLAVADAAEARPLWDDEAAATALNGNRTHIETLRGLFAAELPQVRQRIIEATREGHVNAVNAELHRLRASCGFVGATRLGLLVQALQQAPRDAGALARFDAAAGDTLEQLSAHAESRPLAPT
ncbi:MAG: response regulator [Lysobacter sp.]